MTRIAVRASINNGRSDSVSHDLRFMKGHEGQVKLLLVFQVESSGSCARFVLARFGRSSIHSIVFKGERLTDPRLTRDIISHHSTQLLCGSLIYSTVAIRHMRLYCVYDEVLSDMSAVSRQSPIDSKIIPFIKSLVEKRFRISAQLEGSY